MIQSMGQSMAMMLARDRARMAMELGTAHRGILKQLHRLLALLPEREENKRGTTLKARLKIVRADLFAEGVPGSLYALGDIPGTVAA